MIFKLPKLRYSYNDLEPNIDKDTMEIHYFKYHQGYVDKLNLIVEGDASLKGVTAEYMLADLGTISPEIKQPVVNFAGGHVNNSFFRQIMSPEKTTPGELTNKVISSKWDSAELFLEEFAKRALGFFKTGWSWLVALNSQPGIDVTKTFNQDSPLSIGQTNVSGIDIWGRVETNFLDIERGPP